MKNHREKSVAGMKAKLLRETSGESSSSSDSEDECSPLYASPQEKRKQKTRQILEKLPKDPCSFFLLGLTLIAPFAVIICASEDMLAGTLLATGWVFVAASAPSCFTKFVFLAFSSARNLSLVSRLLGMFIFITVGMFVVAFSTGDIRVRMLGVCIVSIGTAIGEITLLVYAATKFQEVALASFIAGTATGGVLAALPYVGMTSWASVNPRTAVLVPVIWPTVNLLVFAILRTNRLCPTKPHSHIRQEIYDYQSDIETAVPFYKERAIQIWKSADHLVLLFLVYFSVYISLGGVLSTLVFSHTKDLGPREDFQHYVLSTLLGEFFGRTFMSLVRCKTPGITYRIPVWCGVISVFFMVLFICASWYRFILRVWIVFVLCFLQGTTSGVFASNAYSSIANRTLAQHAVFLVTLASLLESCGILAAGLMGLHTEPALRVHCIETRLQANETYCLSRATSSGMWVLGRGGKF